MMKTTCLSRVHVTHHAARLAALVHPTRPLLVASLVAGEGILI